MPIKSEQITLSETVPVQIVQPDNMVQHVHLHNMAKSNNHYVHIGGPDVTINNSIHIDPGESIHLQIRPNDDLYAVSDPDGLVLGVLTITKRD